MNKQSILSACLITMLFPSNTIPKDALLNENDDKLRTIASEYFELALTMHKENNEDKAIAYYKKALTLYPDYIDALRELGALLLYKNEPDDAIECLLHAHDLKPDDNEILCILGEYHAQVGNISKAISYFSSAITNDKDCLKAHVQLGKIYEQTNQEQEALYHFQKAVDIDPQQVEARLAYGNALKRFDRLEQALDHYKAALAIEPKNIHLLMELANTLNMLEQNDEALDLYMQVLEINPNVITAMYNIGYTLKKQGYFDKAIEIYRKVLELKPDYALAHFSLALSYLSIGDFENGFLEYEWRWKAYSETPKQLTEPVWDGSDLQGKTIFVYTEQGLGDTVQFMRYAKLLNERGATVIVEAQTPLIPLLSLCPYIDYVISRHEQNMPPFDYQIPLISLPLLFDTRVETIPAQIPYLYADEKLVEYWKEELSNDQKFKIGICWQGNARYARQPLKQAVANKSIPLACFEPLAQLERISLYSLQKVDGIEQLDNVRNSFIIHELSNVDEEHGRFMDSAAIIKNLDLIISVDTSIAHLAGAIGVNVWLLLPYTADWRWLLGRTDSPWYPTMRLFKQPSSGDWTQVIETIKRELIDEFDKKNNNKIKLEMPSRTENTDDPMATYFKYAKTNAVIASLVETLKDINQQLLCLEERCKEHPFSTLDQKSIDIARKVCYAHDLKMHIQKKIEEAVDKEIVQQSNS